MSRIAGRRPNASGQISTPACAPVAGWMKTASHVPSGVLMSTFFSTTGPLRRRRAGGGGDAGRDGHRDEFASRDVARLSVFLVILFSVRHELLLHGGVVIRQATAVPDSAPLPLLCISRWLRGRSRTTSSRDCR